MSTLSVVVPAFNEEGSIGDCLDHLLNQTRPIDEIIIVDNASTDRTADVVSEYIAEYGSRVRLVHEPTKGIVAARRCGFDAASSDIIARTDADTLAKPEWADQIVSFLDSRQGADYAAVTGLILASDGPAYDRMHKLALGAMGGKLKDGGDIESIAGANFALRSDAWHAVKDSLSDRADIWDDLDLGLALRERQLKRYFLPAMIVDTSMRQFRHSPWENRQYILAGIRTAAARGDRKVVAMMCAELPFRIVTFTGMWLIFRPWDDDQKNWRPHRLLKKMKRERKLITSGR
ncbi:MULTISPECIES: glycosyltransferase family 2 protein [Gordonia]|uniref:glycosyltransferase family 2 protein n=1 Tax=Gordonia TaxID=2053 RepID=UPI0007EBB339|nr:MULTISPECIES: glycosyltransferase family A protein [Gordonia]OBA43348.1 glycosyltransferase [Gordonia sp. 852002-51296_SCH5728562-b]